MLQEGVIANQGSDLSETLVVVSDTFRQLSQRNECIESRMIRNYFSVPHDENNTYIDNLKCFSSSGVYTMNRQAACGDNFLNVLVSILQVINKY